MKFEYWHFNLITKNFHWFNALISLMRRVPQICTCLTIVIITVKTNDQIASEACRSLQMVRVGSRKPPKMYGRKMGKMVIRTSTRNYLKIGIVEGIKCEWTFMKTKWSNIKHFILPHSDYSSCDGSDKVKSNKSFPVSSCRKFSKFGLFFSISVNSDWGLQRWSVRKYIW